jgi:predicted RNase H-related nuclease YkuK (DUF458 family)
MSSRKKVVKEIDFNFEEIRQKIKESDPNSTIYVGCDSIRKREIVVYFTAIIIHYGSKHGGCIFKSVKVLPNYEKSPKALRMRLMNEVGFASAAALEIIDHLDGRLMEIHLDINSDVSQLSNIVLKEAIGYVIGMTQITPKVKPDAFASSIVSDKYVRLASAKVRN